MRGDLTSLRWIEGPITPDYQYGNFVNIIYASLNFKDVMVATNKLNLENFMSRGRLEDCMLGIEYAGINNDGRRIMGICETQYVIATSYYLDINKYKIILYFFIQVYNKQKSDR